MPKYTIGDAPSKYTIGNAPPPTLPSYQQQLASLPSVPGVPVPKALQNAPAEIKAASSPGVIDRLKDTVANSAIGHSIQQELPKVADALNLHPNESVNSPTYTSDQEQLIAPQFLAPNNPQTAAGRITKGVLTGTGQLTSAPSLATTAAIAATGGLAAPLADGAGIVGTVGQLGTRAIKGGMAAQGAYGVGSNLKNAYNLYRRGDTPAAQEAFGATLPNAAMMLPTLAEPMKITGGKSQEAGEGVINRGVLGVRKADTRRGANPGRGYFQGGFGPSLSMRSIANKAATGLDKTGDAIGSAIDSGTGAGVVIPGSEVRSVVEGPAKSAAAVMDGPFGPGSAALDERMARFDDAIQPEMNPKQVFTLKRNVAQNVNWSDPTAVGVKQVGQQIAGGLSGLLSDYVPELGPLNDTYQNQLALERVANDRATTGQRSLTSMGIKAGVAGAGAALGGAFGGGKGALLGLGATALDSVPVKTSVASGLYYGGKGLSAIGSGINRVTSFLNVRPEAMSPTVHGIIFPDGPRQLGSGLPGEAQPYSPDFSAGGFATRPPVTTPPPSLYRQLPANASGGEVQPMIGVRSTQSPQFDSDFARTRIAPNRPIQRTLQPELNGMALPAPRSPFMLPSNAGPGEVQPMVTVKTPAPYPPLADQYASMRVNPTRFSGPPENPLGHPKALLNAANSPKIKARKR